jgi:hypothetical protein
MKNLLDFFKAVGIVILIVAATIAIPIVGILLAVAVVTAVAFLTIRDHRREKAEEKRKWN